MSTPSRWPVRLCASFTEEQRELLEEAAQDKATSISSIIRRAVEAYLVDHPTSRDDGGSPA